MVISFTKLSISFLEENNPDHLIISDLTVTLSLTIVATNELHDFNHVLGCNYEKDLHLWIQN